MNIDRCALFRVQLKGMWHMAKFWNVNNRSNSTYLKVAIFPAWFPCQHFDHQQWLHLVSWQPLYKLQTKNKIWACLYFHILNTHASTIINLRCIPVLVSRMLRVSLSISGLQNVPGVQAGGPHWLYHRVLPTTQREEGGEREREEREREREKRERDGWKI